jgi:hypothetical protein
MGGYGESRVENVKKESVAYGLYVACNYVRLFCIIRRLCSCILRQIGGLNEVPLQWNFCNQNEQHLTTTK